VPCSRIETTETCNITLVNSDVVRLCRIVSLCVSIFVCLTVHLQVWTALLSHMPMLALMKNINRLASLGLLEPLSDCVQTVIDKLGNEQHLQDAKYVEYFR